MKSWEYIIQSRREDIDFINKVIEACEDIGNVRTLDNKTGLLKIITTSYFLSDVDTVLEKLKNSGIQIEIVDKREWLGVL